MIANQELENKAMSEMVERDAMIVRAFANGDPTHIGFHSQSIFGMNYKQVIERHAWIKAAGEWYNSKIDAYISEFESVNIRRDIVSVYLWEKKEGRDSPMDQKKALCYEGPKRRLEKAGLYPVSEEVYQKSRFT